MCELVFVALFVFCLAAILWINYDSSLSDELIHKHKNNPNVKEYCKNSIKIKDMEAELYLLKIETNILDQELKRELK